MTISDWTRGMVAGLLLVGAGLIGQQGSSAAGWVSVGERCRPAVLDMGALEGHDFSVIAAMNDRGWAVGASQKDTVDERLSTPTLWRNGRIIDLSLPRGGDDGGRFLSHAVDVNENGAVLVNRWRDRGFFNWLVSGSVWVWQRGGGNKLFGGTGGRPVGGGFSLHDFGVVVGAHDRRERRGGSY